MKIQLNYGTASRLNFQIEEEDLLYVHGLEAPSNISLANLPEMVRAALEEPLEFPSLGECLLDDDSLSIPLAPGTPHAELLLRGIFSYIFTLPAVHQPAQITILRTQEDESAGVPAMEAIFPEEIAETISFADFSNRVKIQTHHPDRKEEAAFLGVAESNETLVIHRKLFDAEFILPVGSFKPKGSTGYFGIHSPIYPTFSDAETLKRFEGFGPQMHASNHKLMHQLEHEIADASRQLGLVFALQTVPGLPGVKVSDSEFFEGESSESGSLDSEEGSDSVSETVSVSGIASVLAGNWREVEMEGNSLFRNFWTYLSERRPNIVLASVSGRESESWQSAMEALTRAAKIAVPESGIIVLCTDLAAEEVSDLPRSLQIYHQVQDPATAEKFIRRENLSDANAAISAIRIFTQYRVFFLSKVNGELLEELNVMPLANSAELERLVENGGSVSILPDAHRIIL